MAGSVAAVTQTPAIKGLALGLFAGVMSGVFGIGGGAVMVPLLVLRLGLAQHRAHATSLAAIIVTAAAGMARFAGDDEVHYVAGLGIAAGAVVGAFVGAQLMNRLSPSHLRRAFAVLMVLVSLQMLSGYTPEGAVVALSSLEVVAAYLLLGVAVGTLSGLLGVGGGVLIVPATVLLFGFTQHAAEGTSLLIIIPAAIVGSLRHAQNGHTDWRLAAMLGTGGVGGAWVGASVALSLDGDLLQRLFAIFLLLTGAQLLWLTRPGRPAAVTSEVV